MGAERKTQGIDWRPWAVVIVALLCGGAAYRLAAASLRHATQDRVLLPVPLAQVPKEQANWTGTDQPLSKEVLKVAGVDDYLNRRYVNRQTGEWANLYVAYCGRPRTMRGHKPTVCYPAHGWVHDGTTADQLTLPSGRKVPCLIHRFHHPPPQEGEVVVLNYYVCNGVVTNDEGAFDGLEWRLPNINGNPAYYVAQIQVSNKSEAAVRNLAAATVERILDFLPDSERPVKAAEKRCLEPFVRSTRRAYRQMVPDTVFRGAARI